MSVLKQAIVEAFGEDARFPPGHYPEAVPLCIVPRARFAEAARILKKTYALLAAEWATDEVAFGIARGFGVFACYRYGPEYIIVKAEVPADFPVFPSLTKKFVSAYRFERQIESLMGLTP